MYLTPSSLISLLDNDKIDNFEQLHKFSYKCNKPESLIILSIYIY